MMMHFQVADIHRPFLSLSRAVDQGFKSYLEDVDMGEPVKIYDLACRMIELSGFRVKQESSPDGDIAIEVIGLRPGEKLYEELLIGNDPKATRHPRIMKANEKSFRWNDLQPMITTLRIAALNGDVMMIFQMLKLLVPEYQIEATVVDWVYREQISQVENIERTKSRSES